jgi:hypothetical protein
VSAPASMGREDVAAWVETVDNAYDAAKGSPYHWLADAIIALVRDRVTIAADDMRWSPADTVAEVVARVMGEEGE